MWDRLGRTRPPVVGMLVMTGVLALCLGGLARLGALPGTGTGPLEWGVYLPDDASPSSRLRTMAVMAQEQPHFVMRFAAVDEPVPVDALDGIRDAGSTPIVTLEPWVPGQGADQPDYSLARIARGVHDEALRRWATGLAAHEGPVLLRFAHEMNSTWYPWSVGTNGNTPEDYVAAWTHLHEVFRAVGAEQVSFVWAPNVPYPGSADLASAYPGADNVDYLGLDGYNWGDGDGHVWQDPREVFADGLEQLRELDGDRPILVTEVASAEGPHPGTDKAGWIEDLVDYLGAADRVVGFVWFQATKERDWRINSTAGSERALRVALAGRR